MLQDLPYFWNTKTHVVFFVFNFVQLSFSSNGIGCPVYDDILGEKIKLNEMKNKKIYMGFYIPKIWQILKHFDWPFHEA